MPPQIPEHVVTAAYEAAFKEAESISYLGMTLAQSGMFIDHLVKHPEVGGRLKAYLTVTALRTYVKDALLRKYAKRKRAAVSDNEAHLRKALGEFDEIGYSKDRGVWLLRRHGGEMAFAAITHHPKWEVGLRNLLIYKASCQAAATSMTLIIVCLRGHVNGADKALIEKALTSIEVNVCWIFDSAPSAPIIRNSQNDMIVMSAR